MLDVKFIRENLELVEKSAKEKGYKINIQEVLDFDDKRKKELARVEELRRKRNEIAAKMKGGKPDKALIDEGKKVKEELAKLEEDLTKVEQEYKAALKAVPNIIFDDVPLGGEECSVEVKSWGGKKKEGVDHLDYAMSRDWVDFERGAKVAGAKFYYLKNELALLENALIQFGLKKVLEKGFTFITVPVLVSSQVLE
ncbi:serine--tRNA ligase, partial [Candidatus Saccharibacteria bacterium]|nr:serine--tRNA ligase [Candidatus Saccharibacteria bacterium]